ncbi:hypothetical protein [Candidatus Viridilinea mediisalina]|uniref:MalT-like TPR region domain-containing protein n=1 Tax=Candidatus Viridilinea mediisalina TaxID=2024553 RepID=A0A2A6RGU1_9CHLR|nr:hypothetical protein [Candidatus Viridilinea mediisalina]PDW02098.1 hypothetical protein CJ255_15735 [Candidatus Viridilinea mediisalina]
MRAELPQLRHAFAWAVANDLNRAQQLIGDCAELQAAFGLAREGLVWCEEALAAAEQRGTPSAVASAWVLIGNARSRVANLAGEDRRARLHAALAAYDEALRFRTPESAPLAYAATQNNRAAILSAIASLAGEDRRARLRAALAAYDEALRFYTPESAPLDYAMTQGNLLNLHRMLADDPAEQRRTRLSQALRCGIAALTIFQQQGHAEYQQRIMGLLQRFRTDLGGEFAELWAELAVGPLPAWLADAPDQPSAALHEAIQARLAAAGVTDEASLQRALAQDPALFIQMLIAALLQMHEDEELDAFWQQVPVELEEPLIVAAEQLLAQAEEVGDANLVAALGPRIEGLRHLRL